MRRAAQNTCFIIPSHMLERIAENGDADQRRMAFRNLEISHRVRAQREILGRLQPPSVPSLLARKPHEERTVFDARHGEDLPGSTVRREGAPRSKDGSVNEAYDGAGKTWDFYEEVLGRDSVDGRGLRLDSSVHYERDYNNAFWNGRQMVYGDGDGRVFRHFTGCLDVIGHELTHGVTQYEAGLVYQGQPGALNESFSDVFGILVKQWSLGQTAREADWLIGEGVLGPGIQGKALRSMAFPGTAYDDPLLGRDPQPAHMKYFYTGASDNGGVHINSGIPNLAFCTAALALGGKAWDKAGKIWYLALRDKLKGRSGFSQAAEATMAAAGELYGKGSKAQKAVRDGWKKVGIQTT